MSIIDINTNPSEKELRWFGVMIVVFVTVVGTFVHWQFGLSAVSLVFWAVGVVLAAVYISVPSLRLWIFIGWTYAVFPIGWIVSYVLLAGIYYLVFTPIGFIVRVTKGDPLDRKLDRTASTYWKPHEAPQDMKRYFRQF